MNAWTDGPPLPPRRQGRIILLHGASSSGKSTLARELQAALETPFLHFSSDQLVGAELLPVRRDEAGPFAWWEEMRPRFFEGFHRCIAALATAGNDLIVEHVIEYRAWRAELFELLHDFDTFLVAVHCDLAELDRRERARGDRRLGEGRAHVEEDRIHDMSGYDFEVDTTEQDPRDLANQIIDELRHRGPVPALTEGRKPRQFTALPHERR